MLLHFNKSAQSFHRKPPPNHRQTALDLKDIVKVQQSND